MNNVAALQNQLALDVQQRMKSIESLLEGTSDAPSKPDPEVEYWKAQIRKLSEGGPPTTSQSHNDKISADKPKKVTSRDRRDSERQQALKTSYELAQEGIHHPYDRVLAMAKEGNTLNQSMKSMSVQPQRSASRRAPQSTANPISSGIHAPQTKNPHLHRGAVPVGHSGWFRAFDPKTGRPYLFNPKTKETKWEHHKKKSKPKQSLGVPEAAPAPSRSSAPQKVRKTTKSLCMKCFDTDCKCDPRQKAKSQLCSVCFDIPCKCR